MSEEQTATSTPPGNDAPPPDSYDAMSAVFDEIITPAERPAEAPAASTTEVEPASAKPTAETSPADMTATPPADAPTDTAATPPAETTAPVEETPPVDDWKAKYEALMAERAQAPAAEPPPAKEAAPQPEPEIYTADEKEFLATYRKDWPDMARGEALIRRAEYRELVSHVFSQIAEHYGPLIEQGARGAEQSAELASLTIIRASHPDYDDKMYDAVIDWAQNVPGFQGKAIRTALEEGDPQDVVDVIATYKEAKGKTKVTAAAPASAAPAAATPPKSNVTQLSPQAKQAASALSVVESKRSNATTNVADPSDFDAAWNEALGT